MIVDAAAPLFAKQGFSGTTTKQIAKAAGISEALLYKHFPSKVALYKEIQNSSCSDKQFFVEKLTGLPSCVDTLILINYFFYQHILLEKEKNEENHETVKHLMLHSLLEDGQFMRAFLENSFLPILAKCIECIEAGKESGEIIAEAVPAKLGAWFSHHIIAQMGFFFLPATAVVDYGCTKEELMLEGIRFSLRGLGLKDEVLQKKAASEALKKLAADFMAGAAVCGV
ncbi:MAG: TetR/AcrR family transcriptional regulator [bacterium]|nr:TetR/AcrR family transcriptional regulator [bacterium]